MEAKKTVKKKKSGLNYENLNVLKAHLEKQLDSPSAARFNMRYFGQAITAWTERVLEVPVCKTQACLAGESILALALANISPHGGIIFNGSQTTAGAYEIEKAAVKHLGLNEPQRIKLFYHQSMGHRHEGKALGWPVEYQDRYDAAKTPQGRLYAAIRRLEKFIQSKGRV